MLISDVPRCSYLLNLRPCSVQFNSVTQSCPTLCDPMNRSMPGLPVHHQLPEFTQTHVHWVGDAIQPSHPLSSPSPPAPNPSRHQSLFQWVNSSHEVAKVLELIGYLQFPKVHIYCMSRYCISCKITWFSECVENMISISDSKHLPS